MYKTLVLAVVLLSLIASAFLSAEEAVSCSPELKPYWNKLMQIEEVRQCVAEIQQEGPLSIGESSHSIARQFGAAWDIEERRICINLAAHRSEGQVFGSILFELQNALADKKFNVLEREAVNGRIDKEAFVRGMEYIEYENSLRAAKCAGIGIQKGLLPPDARLPTYRNFEEHYYYQKFGKHSIVFEEFYDEVTNQVAR